MSDGVLARLAALKTMPTPELKQQWRDLFDKEPPPYNRRFLESRLAYRIQELAYGGLKPETVERLEALGEQLAKGKRIGRFDRQNGGRSRARGSSANGRASSTASPSATTTTSIEGRPYKSLSSVARAITGTRWNGWVFFGLKNQRVAK